MPTLQSLFREKYTRGSRYCLLTFLALFFWKSLFGFPNLFGLVVFDAIGAGIVASTAIFLCRQYRDPEYDLIEESAMPSTR